MSDFRFSMKDHMDAAAAIVAMDRWEPYRWELLDGGGALVSGCVPSGYYTRGPKKGLPKFRPATPGTERRVAVADAHMNQVATAYEAERGDCWDCKGTGQTFAGWSAETGTRTRTCTRCNGSGKAGATA